MLNQTVMRKVEDIKAIDEIESIFPKPENYEDIKADIAKRGIQESLVISQKNELVCGYTRLTAARELNIVEIPCRVVPLENISAMVEYAILDNIRRRQLSDLEIVEYGMVLEDLYEDRQGQRTDLGTECPQVKGKTRDLVVKQLEESTGVKMSGRKFDRLKKIVEETVPEVRGLYKNGFISQKQALEFAKFETKRQKRIVRNFENNPKIPIDYRLEKHQEEVWVEEQRKSEERDLFEKNPKLERWREAYEKGELKPGMRCLEAYLDRKEFTGQPRHWPKFSGQKISRLKEWDLDKDCKIDIAKVPLFSPEEWKAISKYADEGHDFEDFRKLGILVYGEAQELFKESVVSRRTYDPNYGNFIADAGDWTGGPKVYVKQGWGQWFTIEFNDGKGKRTQRRFFKHDYWGDTMIEEAYNSIDSEVFSDDNYRELEVHRVQKYVMSWFYFKKETRKVDDVIRSLEKDLERLRREKKSPLPKAEVDRRVLKWLADYELTLESAGNPRTNREGVQTDKRLPNGEFDQKWFDDTWDEEMGKKDKSRKGAKNEPKRE